ncbi:MAG: hypothetical protein WC242_00640 [Candidatus Paceibacterota bacterium]|jgi:hypothetical protein
MSESLETKRNNTEAFFELEHPYEIEQSREEGERMLQKIAVTAEREYVWAFDEATNTWYYYPCEFTVKVDENLNEVNHTARIPDELVYPPGELSYHYHIHPDSVFTPLLKKEENSHKEDFYRVSNQLSKNEDLEAVAKLIAMGYKGFKVVTSIGVTTIEYHPERLDQSQKKHILPGLKISFEEIQKALKDGVTVGIDKILEKFTEHYKGVFVFKFEPFEKEIICR